MTFRWIELESPGKIAIGPHPMGGAELAEELADLRRQGVDILVSMLGAAEAGYLGLSDESKVCEASGLTFVQAPIIDRSVPETPGRIQLVAKRLANDMSMGRNVLIHCRMGNGRSSVMAACVLTLLQLPPKEAFVRISDARGMDVPDTLSQKLWVEAFASTFALPPQTS